MKTDSLVYHYTHYSLLHYDINIIKSVSGREGLMPHSSILLHSEVWYIIVLSITTDFCNGVLRPLLWYAKTISLLARNYILDKNIAIYRTQKITHYVVAARTLYFLFYLLGCLFLYGLWLQLDIYSGDCSSVLIQPTKLILVLIVANTTRGGGNWLFYASNSKVK